MQETKTVKPTPEKPYKGFTAVLYARVSTDDKGQTTESQVREMKNWCECQEVEIIGIYEEEVSAKDLERPELDRMFGRIARGGVHILLAWSESRISRDTADMVQIQKLLEPYKTVIRYVTSPSKPESNEGELTNYIGTWQAKVERKKLSENTKNGMITADAKGIHCGRPLSFCFVHNLQNPEIRKKVKLDGKNPTKIATLESVLDHARQGESLETTACYLGTNRKTLSNALKEEKCLEEFKRLWLENSGSLFAQIARAKGDSGKRDVCLNTNEDKKESA